MTSMMRSRRCRGMIVVFGLAFSLTPQPDFSASVADRGLATKRHKVDNSGRGQMKTDKILMSKESPGEAEMVEMGKEYTGKVVIVHRVSVDCEFENGDTTFLGNLHFSQMGLGTRVDGAGDQYALGDAVTATSLFAPKTGTILMSKKRWVELGKEYTGKVVKVDELSIDCEFENDDTTFLGNLHVAAMGLETRIDRAQDQYSLGDAVTAMAWMFDFPKRRVQMSKRREVFLSKEYTGKVVKVNKQDIDCEFENDDTTFLGNLHFSRMGLGTNVNVGDHYGLGDMVTARPVWFNEKVAQMSKEGEVELGKEYTGKVVKVNKLSVDCEFENDDTTFLGNLHVAKMGLETKVDGAGNVYARGDTVTARVLDLGLRRKTRAIL